MSTQIANQLSRRVFSITRIFDAPRAEVWDAWSRADALARWWGPKGCALNVAALEFRPGGFFHYGMSFPDGKTLWGRFFYREIAAPHRLVFLDSFSNLNCGVARAPFSDQHPLEILNTVTFDERGDRTSVALEATPFGAMGDEREFFQNLMPSLADGYGGTFDQLAEDLAKR